MSGETGEVQVKAVNSVIIYQRWFLNFDKCVTVIQDDSIRETEVGGGVYENSVLSLIFSPFI